MNGKPTSNREHRHVLRRLSLISNGLNVMPTSRNARGIDLLIYNADAHDYKGIQVKALSKLKPPVPLGKSIDILMDHCD